MFFDRAPQDNFSIVEKKLETAIPKGMKEIDEGQNRVYLTYFGKKSFGIFKPKDGEWTKDKGVPLGTFYLRERAAYLVDKALNFNLIPPTVIRTINGKIGSLQQYIPDTQKFGILEWDDQNKAKNANLDKFKNLWLMNYIIFNTDNHKSNLLINKEQKIFSIDHGLSFANTQFDSFLDFRGQKINNFHPSKDNINNLSTQLSDLLPASEVAACLNRIDYVSSLLQQYGGIPSKAPLPFNPGLVVSKVH
jgi:hypothetical protein